MIVAGSYGQHPGGSAWAFESPLYRSSPTSNRRAPVDLRPRFPLVAFCSKLACNRMNSNTVQTLSFFLLLASILFAPLTVQAQNRAGEAYLGVRGGLSQPTVNGDAIGNADAASEAGGGIFVGHNVNEAFSVQLEALYSTRGAENVEATGGPNESDALDLNGATLSMKYLEVPVLFKLTAPISVVNIRGFVGPSLGFQLDAQINGKDTYEALQANPSVASRFLFYDINGIVGGEIGVPVPGGIVDEVAVDGRYNIGLVDVDNNQGFHMKNEALSGTLSLRFDL